jgi:peptidase M23-like protein
MRRIAPLLIVVSLMGVSTDTARAAGDWSWPVIGPLIRPFEPPASPYGAGHRGIDIATPFGTVVAAPAPGTVTFSGPVAGSLFLTIDHGFGLASSYSWVSELLVRAGDSVVRAQPVALSGGCHPAGRDPCLHVGVRRDGAYVDPLDLLSPLDVSGMIRLAPLEPGTGQAEATGVFAWPSTGAGWGAGRSMPALLPGLPAQFGRWSASRMSGLGRTPLPRRGRARSPWMAGARPGWVGSRWIRLPDRCPCAER